MSANACEFSPRYTIVGTIRRSVVPKNGDTGDTGDTGDADLQNYRPRDPICQLNPICNTRAETTFEYLSKPSSQSHSYKVLHGTLLV